MLPFYKLLARVGLIILFCLLFVLAVSQSLVSSPRVFQDIHNCPDNWIYDNSDNVIRCFIPLKTTCTTPVVDNSKNGGIHFLIPLKTTCTTPVVDKSKNGGKLFFHTNTNIVSDVYNEKTPGSSVVLLNSIQTPYINFYDKKWYEQSMEMPSRLCYLQRWANANEISWAGVSNNYSC